MLVLYVLNKLSTGSRLTLKNLFCVVEVWPHSCLRNEWTSLENVGGYRRERVDDNGFDSSCHKLLAAVSACPCILFISLNLVTSYHHSLLVFPDWSNDVQSVRSPQNLQNLNCFPLIEPFEKKSKNKGRQNKSRWTKQRRNKKQHERTTKLIRNKIQHSHPMNYLLYKLCSLWLVLESCYTVSIYYITVKPTFALVQSSCSISSHVNWRNVNKLFSTAVITGQTCIVGACITHKT